MNCYAMGGTTDLQARLALRAVCSLNSDGENEQVWPSPLQRRYREEFSDVLREAFDSRVARVTEKINKLFERNHGQDLLGASTGSDQNSTVSKQRLTVTKDTLTDKHTQTDKSAEDFASVKRLADAVVVAVGSRVFSQSEVRSFGPSDTQVKSKEREPSETRGDLVKERIVSSKTSVENLNTSLKNLMQTTDSREKQIVSLNAQLDVCRQMHKEGAAELEFAENALRHLGTDTRHLRQEHQDKINRRRRRIRELSETLRSLKEQAYQLKRYLMQSKALEDRGMSRFSRYMPGDPTLVPQPLQLESENLETWDVGTAIANPYTCDSWPFEPNVLARRCFGHQSNLHPHKEETEDDLEDSDLGMVEVSDDEIPHTYP